MQNSYRNFLILLAISLIAITVSAQQKPLVSAITETDLRKDLAELASDGFRGREAGTLDELKAAAWLAKQAEIAGMQPAGDNGTWFQYFNLYRHQIIPFSRVSIGEKSYELWKDVLVTEVSPANINAPVVFLKNPSAQEIASANVKGKAVAIQVNNNDVKSDIFLADKLYPYFVRKKYYEVFAKAGAAALIIIGDENSEKNWAGFVSDAERGDYGVEGYNDKMQLKMPMFFLHQSELDFIQNTKENLKAEIFTYSYKYPSVNVVGKIAGNDPVLAKENVLISGHHDHDGIRTPQGNDEIYNGADDNAGTCVAMLAMARAFQKQPAKRSILFVFHGAEERGLLGSLWYTKNPTVPIESITAVLNGDLIGRNDVNEAALLGAKPPHQNSVSLVEAAMQANKEGPNFKIDTSWDDPNHPEDFYYRSDHLPYALIAGIPAIFFTSKLHNQYHTPMDEAKNIDYKKLHKMTEWMYRTAWIIANQEKRPDVIRKNNN